jgi:MFS family permease
MAVLPANRIWRRLFLAQIVALSGTGLATVALGLLAWDLAGPEAGTVLGTALAIKMIAYVGVAPLAAALAERLPKRPLLVGLDLVRAGMAASLPFVTEIWQIYLLIFLLQSASAAFTPTVQALIPEILTDEADYTRALSASRLAYDLEAVASPALAAALLTVIGFHALFGGTAAGFLISASLIAGCILPAARRTEARPALGRRSLDGLRIIFATPRLRGLAAIDLALATAGAMVIVDTVAIAQGRFDLGESETAALLAINGAGSMLAALALPRLLGHLPERRVMLAGTAVLAPCLLAGTLVSGPLTLAILWFTLGLASALAQTPAGRLLRRSAASEDRPALFAAQFALSHACWLLAYPLAGWGGVALGLDTTFMLMAAIAGAATLIALLCWRRHDPVVMEHVHVALPEGHPHLADARPGPRGHVHAHAFVIDRHHRHWPR